MTKKLGAAQAAAETRTFALSRPIADDTGKSYPSITLTEPELHHLAQVERKTTAGENEVTASLIATLAGVPEAAIRRLKLRDVLQIQRWVDEVMASGVKADLLLEAVKPFDLNEPERTFELLVPVALNDATLSRITMREPDLEAGIAVEKFKLRSEQTAALIATCSGQIIPNILRMKVRDVRRIERWVDFLLQPGAEPLLETEAA